MTSGLALLLASSALGAAPAAVPRQLALQLTVSAPAGAAAAAPAAAAAAPRWSFGAPERVEAAFRAGDAVAFYRAAVAARYDPPPDDEHQSALFQQGFERESLESAFDGKGRRAGKLDLDAFGRALRRLNPRLGEHQDAGSKRVILREAGYSRLHGPGGRPMTLDEASDARIGKVFASALAKHRAR